MSDSIMCDICQDFILLDIDTRQECRQITNLESDRFSTHLCKIHSEKLDRWLMQVIEQEKCNE